VVAELTSHGVLVDDLVIADNATRHATMLITRDAATDSRWHTFESALVRWDERDGWAFHVQYPDEPQSRPPVYLGDTPVPLTAVVANWIRFALVHPGFTASRPLGPPGGADLDLLLRGYDTSPD
jgi:hypothetical protein